MMGPDGQPLHPGDPVHAAAAAKGNPFAAQSVRRANPLATFCVGWCRIKLKLC
jgi:hypothetical protein